MIKIGLYGYGNIAKGVECAIMQNEDMCLTSVFTRRNPETVKVMTEGVSVYHIDDILNDLGYSANDFLNVDFVFIVEGKQDKNRLPLLLEKYYSEHCGIKLDIMIFFKTFKVVFFGKDAR